MHVRCILINRMEACAELKLSLLVSVFKIPKAGRRKTSFNESETHDVLFPSYSSPSPNKYVILK